MRWRAAVLYVAFVDSPLLTGTAQLAAAGPQAVAGRPPPELRAPDAAVVVGGRGQSCEEACAEAGPGGAGIRAWRCHDEDLLFLNSCAVLRRIGGGAGACAACVASDRPDQPSVVTSSGEVPSSGTCLWNVNPAEAPRCGASHPWTSRACACRPGAGALARPRLAGPEAPAAPADLSIPTVVEPRTRVRAGLPSHRCGSAFGNALSTDCAAEGLWCCSESMRCGASREACGGASCPRGPSPERFCGAGWSLRLPDLGLQPFVGE
uniref:Uncharacterized protein n=1 Tax=Alexandrium monilatum TaxID=311494 RepID=A0A7S4RYH9_9DINO